MVGVRPLFLFLFALLVASCGRNGTTSHPNVGTEHAALTSALLGVNIDPLNSPPSLADLDAVGATAVRFELKALGGDLGAIYARYDDYIRKLRADPNDSKGVLLIVDYGTVSYTAPMTDAYVASFACAAADIAHHYGPSGPFGVSLVDAIEVWNEPDMPGPNYLPPSDFARLVRATVNAIKVPGTPLIDGSSLSPCQNDGNPAMTVITGGLGGPDPLGATDANGNHVDGDDPSYHHYASDVVAAAGSDWDRVDGFGVHMYTHWPESDTARDPSNNFGWMLDQYAGITDRMLYITEWGDPSGQAEMIQQTLGMFADPNESALVEHVAQAYIFAWSDNQEPCADGPPTGSTDDGTPTCAGGEAKRKYFGLVGGNGSRTDAWQAFQDGAQTIQGHYGQTQPPPPPAGLPPGVEHASRLHGTVTIAGTPTAGLTVSVWGHDWHDVQQTETDEAGIYAFDGLNGDSLYDVVVDGTPDDNGSYAAIEDGGSAGHQVKAQKDVELVAGPDGWHGEDFTLDF